MAKKPPKPNKPTDEEAAALRMAGLKAMAAKTKVYEYVSFLMQLHDKQLVTDEEFFTALTYPNV